MLAELLGEDGGRARGGQGRMARANASAVWAGWRCVHMPMAADY
jgi:hypothetical protein